VILGVADCMFIVFYHNMNNQKYSIEEGVQDILSKINQITLKSIIKNNIELY